MKTFILIFLTLLFFGIVFDFIDGHYSINKQRAIIAEAKYKALETKYYSLRKEFAECWREKNKWAGEVARLKNKHERR